MTIDTKVTVHSGKQSTWQTREARHIEHNIDEHSCNHCCSGKINNYYLFWPCICSLRYPVYNVHAPYCHMWPAWLYNIFPHYPINGKLNIKCILISSTIFVWNISILRRNKQDMITWTTILHGMSSHKRITFSHHYKNLKSHALGQTPMPQIKLKPLIQDCSCGHLAQYQSYDKSAYFSY